MVLINKQPKLICHMASMPINDRRLLKPVMLICFAVLSSCFRVLIKYPFQTTTTLLAALSAGAKTNLLWNSWIPFFKCLKVNLGLGGRRSKLLQLNEILPSIILKIFSFQLFKALKTLIAEYIVWILKHM